MNVSDADAVRADWHDRVDQVLAQSAQEWAGVLEVLRGWDNQAVLLASSLPPNAPNQLTPEDLVWTTGEPPPANSYWSQASYVRTPTRSTARRPAPVHTRSGRSGCRWGPRRASVGNRP